MNQVRELVYRFMEHKGVDINSLSGDSLLLEHLKSVDLMEMIVQLEADLGLTLDLASADIESIMLLDGLLGWVSSSLSS
ncbi:hypothetical protein ACWJJH_07590 [Endozoicomonadaceae bacterium StTr2]